MKGSRFSEEQIIAILREQECRTPIPTRAWSRIPSLAQPTGPWVT